MPYRLYMVGVSLPVPRILSELFATAMNNRTIVACRHTSCKMFTTDWISDELRLTNSLRSQEPFKDVCSFIC